MDYSSFSVDISDVQIISRLILGKARRDGTRFTKHKIFSLFKNIKMYKKNWVSCTAFGINFTHVKNKTDDSNG